MADTEGKEKEPSPEGQPPGEAGTMGEVENAEGREPSAPAGEGGSPNGPTVDAEQLSGILKGAKEVIAQQQKTLEEYRAALDAFNLKEMESLKESVERIENRLPRTIRDEKATVMGYYDFDAAQSKFMSDITQNEYEKAVADMATISAHIRI